MRRLVLASVLLAPVIAAAELPRLVPFVDLTVHYSDELVSPDSPRYLAATRSKEILEPLAYWSHDDLLCFGAFDDPKNVECHDTATGRREIRKRAGALIPPMKSLTLDGVTWRQNGTIESAAQKHVSKLRCGRSPFLDEKNYRYVLGAGGRLAIVMLEADDRFVECAKLDAECRRAPDLLWRVLVTIPACPKEDP